MRKYFSRHEGEILDEAIDYYLMQKELSLSKIIPSTKDEPVDVNTILDEGKYVIYHTTNVYGGSLDSPIEIKVVHSDENTIIQQYEKNNVIYQREYNRQENTWTEWAPLKDFMIVEQEEIVPPVGTDTMVYRHIDNIKDFFKDEEKTDNE